MFVRGDVENILQSLGVAPAAMVTEATVAESREAGEVVPPFISDEPEPDVDVDALFASAGKKSQVKDLDAYWDEAIEKTGNIPINPDVISYEEARKLGLTPDKGATIPSKTTGSLKKK